jgi:hypothetical protein
VPGRASPAGFLKLSTFPQALLQVLLTYITIKDEESGGGIQPTGGCTLPKKLYNVLYYERKEVRSPDTILLYPPKTNPKKHINLRGERL